MLGLNRARGAGHAASQSRLGLLGRRVRIAAVLLAFANCGGPGRVVRVQGAGAHVGVVTDYEVLAAYWVEPETEQPMSVKGELQQSRIVSDDPSLVEAWQKFRLPGKAPSIDFARHEVLFFATLESVVCGVLPITSAERTQDHHLLLRTPRSYTCPNLERLLYFYLSTAPDRPLVVRVIAIPRAASEHNRILWGSSNTATIARRKSAATTPPNPVESSDRTAPLPARGGLDLVSLDDGSRVWIAQHENGEITVLAGDFVLPHSAVGSSFVDLLRNRNREYAVPTVWQPGTRCYNSLFDEFGRSVFRALPSLDRYEFSLDPQHPERLRIGNRSRGKVGDMTSKKCVPADDRVYSAYPRPRPSDPPSWFVHREPDGTVRTIVTGVEFPFEYPLAPLPTE